MALSRLTIENTGLCYLKLALWLGQRYFKLLTVDFPEDVTQIAALAAFTVQDEPDEVAAFRAMSKVFREAMKAYGYRFDRDACVYTRVDLGSWVFDIQQAAITSRPLQACGSPGCSRAAGNRHEDFGWVCGLHIRRVRIVCEECRQKAMGWKRAKKQQARSFCSRSCRSKFYYRLKYGEQAKAQIAMRPAISC